MRLKLVDRDIKEFQRRISADAFDREAVNSLSLILSRIDNSSENKTATFNSLIDLLLPLLKPYEVKDTRYKKEHRWILFSGNNFSYNYPFVSGRLWLREHTENQDQVRGCFTTIDDTMWGFSTYRKTEQAGTLYDEILDYIKGFYDLNNAYPCATFPNWDEVNNKLLTDFYIYDFDY